MADLPKRRPLRGKKLLVIAGMSAISQLDCSSSTVANLIVPPQDAQVQPDDVQSTDAARDVVTPRDDGTTMRDIPVANLLPPPDVQQPDVQQPDVQQPADVTDVPAPQDNGITMRDVPVANLLPPPPDVVQPVDTPAPQDTGVVLLRDVPVANLIIPPDAR